MGNHYLVHLPHYGTKIPEKYLNDYYLSKEELQNNIYQYADLFTDELFNGLYQQFGGVKNSYHLTDRARDFTVKGCSLEYVAKVACEYSSVILYKRHIHIDNRRNKICIKGFYKKTK